MKIAVYFDLPDGGARYALYKILEQIAPNHELDLYTYSSGANLTNFASLKSKLNLLTYPRSVLASSHLGRVIKDLYSLTFLKMSQRKLATIINNGRYDAVYVTHDRFFQAPYILRYLKGKVVFICQEPTRAFFEPQLAPSFSLPFINYWYEVFFRHLKKNIEIKNALHSKITIANSHYSKNSIKSAYDIDSQVVYLGVDPQEFYPVASTKRNEVIVVGNDEPQKNLDLAIEAVSQIPLSKRPILHIITPRAGFFPRVQNLANAKKVQIKVSSKVKTSHLRRFYSSAICTLAVANLEPFGLSVVESMACGTPVVAIREGGYLETVKEGVSGYLVPPIPKEISHAIMHVSKLSSSLCTKYAIQKFAWDHTANNLLKL